MATTLSDLPYPIRTRDVFDKLIAHDWYDGIASGITTSRLLGSFRFDLITWGPGQVQRIFVFSRMADPNFNRIVELLSLQEAPDWAIWLAKWPPWFAGKDESQDEVNRLWSSADSPEYVVAAGSTFEEILAAKLLDQERRKLLPSEFDGQPVSNDFEAWRSFLNL
jgi:hypothetical protein